MYKTYAQLYRKNEAKALERQEIKDVTVDIRPPIYSTIMPASSIVIPNYLPYNTISEIRGNLKNVSPYVAEEYNTVLNNVYSPKHLPGNRYDDN